MLKAGAAKVEITPPVGVRMAGFAGRAFPSLAVHDPLWARALVLDDGETRVGLVAMDVIGVSADMMAEVRSRARSAAGIAPDGLLIAGTHTHSGPRGLEEDATDQEREYWAELPEKIGSAVSDAAAKLAPARVGGGRGRSAAGINRREHVPGGRIELGDNHFGAFDPEVAVLRVEANDGTPLAAVMNYACHAVCLTFDNYLLSADYPGYAVHSIEQEIGGDAVGVFFNGACGNVNPREAAKNHGRARGGGFFIAERAGSEIARQAARAWADIAVVGERPISAARKEVALPTNRQRAVTAAEEALKRAEEAAARGGHDWSPYVSWYDPPDPKRARKRVEELKSAEDEPVRCEVQAIRVGPLLFAGWPGEIFCEFGMELKQRAEAEQTYVIGYANGSIGYVPTREAYSEGGYEVQSALHLADEAGEVLLEETVALAASAAETS